MKNEKGQNIAGHFDLLRASPKGQGDIQLPLAASSSWDEHFQCQDARGEMFVAKHV